MDHVSWSRSKGEKNIAGAYIYYENNGTVRQESSICVLMWLTTCSLILWGPSQCLSLQSGLGVEGPLLIAFSMRSFFPAYLIRLPQSYSANFFVCNPCKFNNIFVRLWFMGFRITMLSGKNLLAIQIYKEY